MKLAIYDTTLRDGAQGAGVSFTEEDRVRALHVFDGLGISYIEVGMLAALRDEPGLRRLLREKLNTAKMTVFVNTCRAGQRAAESETLAAAAALPSDAVTVCGKASAKQVRDVLRTTGEENLRMIGDSIRFLADSGKEVIFDAEHFFDGYGDDPTYALSALECAAAAGAAAVVLCDTNGGNLPDVIGLATEAAKAHVSVPIGIHCHNDLGMAEACSLAAVLSGASSVQGTVSGFGERCGNANLNTMIPLLQLKLGFSCVPPESLRGLTAAARTVCELANRTFDEREPFVGGYAFTHKAGTHIDGVLKRPAAFEQVSPEAVGNARNLVVSGLAGRAALIEKMTAYCPGLDKDSEEVARAVDAVRAREDAGYTYEDAEASLVLLIGEVLGRRRRYFSLERLQVTVDAGEESHGYASGAAAMVKISVGDGEEIAAGEGVGPVNAMDAALRRALVRFYPAVSRVSLTDYKVRVISSDATASTVRVVIESTDGIRVWRTVGVSADVIDASFQALRDSVEYMLSLTEDK